MASNGSSPVASASSAPSLAMFGAVAWSASLFAAPLARCVGSRAEKKHAKSTTGRCVLPPVPASSMGRVHALRDPQRYTPNCPPRPCRSWS
eukprot:scaffold47246_cov81-Phaeocystis_antarctica.AAC.2